MKNWKNILGIALLVVIGILALSPVSYGLGRWNDYWDAKKEWKGGEALTAPADSGTWSRAADAMADCNARADKQSTYDRKFLGMASSTSQSEAYKTYTCYGYVAQRLD